MSLITIGFYITQFAVLILALSIHEAAHAFASYRLGDPTAKQLGRLTLNPAKHVDPVGTLLLPVMAFIFRFPVIGWAKPVPVNTFNLKDPKIDHAFIAVAGPLSNVAQALIYTIAIWLVEPLSGSFLGATQQTFLWWLHLFLYFFLLAGVVVNLILAVFNLIPIPPLDGGWILGGVLPDQFSNVLMQIGQFGIIIIWILLYMGFFSYILFPIIGAYLSSFLPETGRALAGQLFGFV